MSRLAILASLPLLLLPACRGATRPIDRPSPSPPAHEDEIRLTILDDRLRRAYEILLERSPSFRSAAELFETGPVKITIGYAESFPHDRYRGHFTGLAAIFPGESLQLPHGEPLDSLHVVFFTRRLEQVAIGQMGVPEEEVITDLAILLAHELYGHVASLSREQSPRWPPPCRDPHWTEGGLGCAGEAENLIRRELGISPRASHMKIDLLFVCVAMPVQCERLRAALPSQSEQR